MNTYIVLHDYRSAWGVLTKDQTIKLDDDTAAWLNRDSPNTVMLYVPPTRAIDEPPKTRHIRRPPATRAVDDGE